MAVKTYEVCCLAKIRVQVRQLSKNDIRTFLRFSLNCLARRKTRETLIYKKNPAETSPSNIVFPLAL